MSFYIFHIFVIILVIIISIIMGYNKNYFYIQNSDFVPFPKIILVGSIFESEHLCFFMLFLGVLQSFSLNKACKLFGVGGCEVDIFLYPHMSYLVVIFLILLGR